MSRFSQVQQILTDSVNNSPIGGHGKWWEGLSRDEFVDYRIFQQKVVEVGRPDDSIVIHALEGTNMFARPMPIGFPPVPQQQIDFIRRWISDGCPDN
jgi:hypothetical protein